ncbi:hypothetical protein [Vreelandella utahensis]|uniref:hypothetical protein n=1 Tax=Vreelandella halophila TaxID=86177 RepID=UPI000986206B|nr:hypothetical protein [Halomonas utahensis]
MTVLSHQDFVAVPISLELYQELLRRHGTAANAVIEDQVEAFLERTDDDVVAPSSTDGITWGTIFLPEKTQLRTKYYNEYRYAEVVGDGIIYEGERFSHVAQATNQMRGGTQNNAWKVLEILRPTDSRWLAAEFLRRRA